MNLYKGVFVFPVSTYRLYRWASSEGHAKIIMAVEIAKRQGRTKIEVLSFLKEHPNSYYIKIEVEANEQDDEEETADKS